MRRFPRVWLDFTIEQTSNCSTCGTTIVPFTPVYMVEIKRGKNAFRLQCETCICAEIEMRIDVVREEHMMQQREDKNEVFKGSQGQESRGSDRGARLPG